MQTFYLRKLLIENRLKSLSNIEKIKKVLLKNDKDKELDINMHTKKILIKWAETTEKAKKYEVSLYINQLLDFYISTVRGISLWVNTKKLQSI